jgi:hypothetical protein
MRAAKLTAIKATMRFSGIVGRTADLTSNAGN